MNSNDRTGGRLDATAGREVVYCHACGQEWYRSNHGLTCPHCESEITEIISPDNDPREMGQHHSSASTSPEIPPYRYQDDSDPDEADIEEHTGPHGFHYRRSVREGTDREHHNPAMEPVLERFVDMINAFGPPPVHRTGGSGSLSPTRHTHSPFGEAQVRHATLSTANGGTASFTFVSGPAPRTFGDAREGAPRTADPFQAILANILRDMGPPEAENRGRPQPAFAQSLQEMLNFLTPMAPDGDAVYSQEALDRIITNLMDSNPQSNAAPPASEDALSKLERRPMDQSMMNSDGKTECTICIDDMNLGDVAATLPCKHFFHEDCVVLWLKEHNTCPVCRTPIEKNEGRNNNGASRGTNASASSSGGTSRRTEPPPVYNSPFAPGGIWATHPSLRMEDFGTSTPSDQGSTSSRPARLSRPPSQSQSRLNEAMRSISSRQIGERERARDRANTPGSSSDTSRLQRRNSLSPTSPRAAPGEQGLRIRHRSPSSNSRTPDSESRRQSSSHGPISWLRGRFSSNGGSGNGSSRDEGRN